MATDNTFLEELFAQRDPLRRVRDAMACLRVVEAYLLNQTPEMTPRQAQGLVQQAGRQLVTVNRTFEEIPRDTLVLPQPAAPVAPSWFIGRLVESPGKPARVEYYVGPKLPREGAEVDAWGSQLEEATQFQDKAFAEEVRLLASGHPYPSFVRSYADAIAINESTSALPPPVAPARPASSRPSLAPIRTEMPPPPMPAAPAPSPPPLPMPPDVLSPEEALHLVRLRRRVDKVVGPWRAAGPDESSWERYDFLAGKPFHRVRIVREATREEVARWQAVRWYDQEAPDTFISKDEAMAWCMRHTEDDERYRVVYLLEYP